MKPFSALFARRRIAAAAGVLGLAAMGVWIVWGNPAAYLPFVGGSHVPAVNDRASPPLGRPSTSDSRAERLDPRERFTLATEALSANDPEQAQMHLQAISSAPGFEDHAHLLQSAILMRSGKFDEAVEGLGRAARREDLRAQALAYLGEALLRTNRPGNAQKALEEAIRLDPDCVDAHRWLGAMYYDLGAMEHAIRHLREVGRLAPRDPRPFRLIGLIEKDYARYESDVEDYRECLRRDPRQPDASKIWLELARCEAKLLRHAEAIQSIEHCERTAESLVLKAECHRSLGQREAAQSCLDQALKISPRDLPALLLAGAIALDDGDPQTARDLLLAAVESHPKEDVAHYRLAQTYAKLGQSDLAQRHLELSTKWKEIRQRFSDLHLDAINRPLDADVRCQIGLLARELDKPELAETWFRATLAIDPLHKGALEAMASLKPTELRVTLDEPTDSVTKNKQDVGQQR